jgi:hypothetical protein
MDVSTILDILAILAALFGIILNILLFWVICTNRSIDLKCTILYKNLAVADIFNCIVIPTCYFNITGKGFNCLESHTNSILYLLFGGAVNIPYATLILLSVVRVMILKYQVFYTRRLRSLHLKVLCVMCWLIFICTGSGIWVGFILAGSVDFDVLIGIMRAQSVVTLTLITTCLALIISTLVSLHQLISNVNDRNYSDPNTALTASVTESQFVKNNKILVDELYSVRRTFLYFLVSVIVWSSYPFTFSLSFTVCGPYYNSTATTCQLLQVKGLADPKTSYAWALLFLCGMSTANSVILLQQKSFKSVLLDLWVSIRGTCSETVTVPNPEDQPIQQAHPTQRGDQVRGDRGNGGAVIPSVVRSTDHGEIPETMYSYGAIN